MKKGKSFREILEESMAQKGQKSPFSPLKTPVIDSFVSVNTWSELLHSPSVETAKIQSHQDFYRRWLEQFPTQDWQDFSFQEPAPPAVEEKSAKKEISVAVHELPTPAQLALEQLTLRGANGLEGPTLSRERLKKEYRRLALRLHPDLHQGNPRKAEEFHAMHEEYDMVRLALESWINSFCDSECASESKNPHPAAA